MPIPTITHQNRTYPAYQAEGNAAQFIRPFAEKICKGTGYDVGYSKPEWKFPGAIGVDLNDGTGYHADNLPPANVDYIFSSHCLEHVPDWVATLDHWTSKLNPGGVLFLYLPDYSQTYWRPWNNRKHIHVLSPQVISDYLQDRGYTNIFASGVDLNNSFTIMADRPM